MSALFHLWLWVPTARAWSDVGTGSESEMRAAAEIVRRVRATAGQPDVTMIIAVGEPQPLDTEPTGDLGDHADVALRNADRAVGLCVHVGEPAVVALALAQLAVAHQLAALRVLVGEELGQLRRAVRRR